MVEWNNILEGKGNLIIDKEMGCQIWQEGVVILLFFLQSGTAQNIVSVRDVCFSSACHHLHLHLDL